VRDIFGCFSRSQQPKGKSKDRIAVALVKDLERFCLSIRCLLQQLLVCFLARQSKRSIL
jgi:hypothetical protein